MARLHHLDPAPVRARLDGCRCRWPRNGIGGVEPRRVRRACVNERIWWQPRGGSRSTRRLPAPEVVCHGDLHPFNLLVDPTVPSPCSTGRRACSHRPPYDVAFTGLVLAEPPVGRASARSVPLVRAAGRWLARRFRRAYSRHAAIDIDPAALRWNEGVVCLRTLVEVAHWVTAGQVEERRGHPWLVSGPAFATRLSA